MRHEIIVDITCLHWMFQRLQLFINLPDVMKYLFWSSVAAAAAASICCRTVHVVTESMEADG